MDLKDIKFTKEDFDMLIKGLEALPHQGQAGEFMADLMETMVLERAPEEFKRERAQQKARKEQEKEKQVEQMKEDCWILQAKLVQLRRYMEQNKLIAEAQDIINS